MVGILSQALGVASSLVAPVVSPRSPSDVSGSPMSSVHFMKTFRKVCHGVRADSSASIRGRTVMLLSLVFQRVPPEK